jgi:hypothetical protein
MPNTGYTQPIEVIVFGLSQNFYLKKEKSFVFPNKPLLFPSGQ